MKTMLSLLQQSLDTYTKYVSGDNSGDGKLYAALFLLSLVFLYVQGKKEDNRHVLLWYSLCVLALIFFPVFAYVYDKMPGLDVYWRMFWLIPYAIVIAYAGTKLVERISKKGKKVVVVMVMLAAIALGGNCIYTREGNFSAPENAYKIPEAALEICRILTAREENPLVIVPYELTPYIRQADSSVRMLYGRDMIVGWKSESSELAQRISTEIMQGDPDTALLVEMAREAGCKYLVLNIGQAPTVSPTEYEFEVLEEFGEYVMYVDSTAE